MRRFLQIDQNTWAIIHANSRKDLSSCISLIHQIRINALTSSVNTSQPKEPTIDRDLVYLFMTDQA
jgi:hypothetical protein